MKIATKLISLAAAALMGTAASAATIGFTEGQRADVAGTTRIVPVDAASGMPGFDLGTINSGDDVNLHGRIVTQVDTYTFTATSAVKVKWIFGGYALAAGGFETDSGFVAAAGGSPKSPSLGAPGSTADLMFTDGMNVFTPSISPVSTDIVAGNPAIISLAAGTYSFSINGLNSDDALYDIQISAVPLPAGAVLLLTGLAGFGLARRRRT